MQTLIQTNHGISFPVVGVNRVKQDELMTSEEEPPAADEKNSSSSVHFSSVQGKSRQEKPTPATA